jgi:nitrogen regulatory protein P-II 1
MRCAKPCRKSGERTDRDRGQRIWPAKGHTELYRGAEYVVDFLPKVKIEIVVTDTMLSRRSRPSSRLRARKIGDGKIFVTSVEQVVRIRTGETNEAAI